MSDYSLHCERVHLWRGDRHVLKGVEFELHQGEILQVTGANGAGKTTLLRTLCGLAYPEEGRVLWNGADIRHDMPAYHSAIAYIGHEPPLKADLTAGENLHFWAGLRSVLSKRSLGQVLEQVGARDWSERPVRTLSAGQKRRVALAGLLLMGASLWILDEPATNLDAAGQRLVAELIADHAEQGGLVVAAVHHDLSGTTRRLELA